MYYPTDYHNYFISILIMDTFNGHRRKKIFLA